MTPPFPPPSPEPTTVPASSAAGRALPGGSTAPAARTSLAVRVTLLVIAVAVLVAVIASVVGVLVVRRTLIDVTTKALADRADVIAAALAADTAAGDPTAGDPARAGSALSATAAVLADQGITVIGIGTDGEFTDGSRAADQAAAAVGAHQAVGGRSISGSAFVGGRLHLVEARSTAAGGFALVAPAEVADATRQALERRLLWAIVGGVVAAVLVGLLVARVVSAPLRRTAGLARAMGQGARDLRAPVAGPREVAEVSVAVNELADALQHSESRQREFLTSVSHELRTPLAGINGQAQALADGLVPEAEQAEVGRSITAEAARLERLVSDLLDLARLGADSFRLDLAPTDLTVMVEEMARVWRARCEPRGVPLLVQVPPFPVWLSTDARRVRQVLDGLAENALRQLGAGQPLVLWLGVQERWAVLQVRDGGPGLAPEDYPVAFEPGVLHARYRGRRRPRDLPGGVDRVVVPGEAGSAVRPGGAGLVVVPDEAGSAVGPGGAGRGIVPGEDGPAVGPGGAGLGVVSGDVAPAVVLGQAGPVPAVVPGGAGLGLALASSLVGRLGGAITAYPAPEGGVAITVRLPLTG